MCMVQVHAKISMRNFICFEEFCQSFMISVSSVESRLSILSRNSRNTIKFHSVTFSILKSCNFASTSFKPKPFSLQRWRTA